MLPPLPIVTERISPLTPNAAVAAPFPDPSIVTIGSMVYPLPLVVTVNVFNPPEVPKTAVACAV